VARPTLSSDSRNDESGSEGEIAYAILDYLLKHPDAKDTLEGIAQWWLLDRWTEQRVVDVQRAVSGLLSKGLIVETCSSGTPPHYGINRRKESEIAEVLKQK